VRAGEPMRRRSAALLVAATALFAGAACELKKSANPLSPTVAGPLPGVHISTPKMVDPAPGAKVEVDKQPITLTVENATTNGVRPLTYVFDVASDANFANKVFSRSGIAPGDGRTSVKLPSPLATGRTYYWRARAEDGANTGAFAGTASFDIYTPIVVGAPVLVSPAVNTTVTSLRPRFTVINAPRSGPVGAISYLLELSDSSTFATKVSWTFAEQASQTSFDTPTDLQPSKVYYWHARAADPTTVGPFSETRAFATPAAAAPPPPAGGGPAPNDAIDLGLATIENSPSDVARWPATATITRLDLGLNGAHVDFTKKDGPGSWPDVPFITPGETLQYTLWIVLNINGRWYASGCIQFWRGLDRNGGPPSQYGQNWYYDPIRWGPMAGYQPATGEMVGFLVTAGDARNNGNVVVKERSNVVMVPFPTSGGVFTFSSGRSQFTR
jgi:hypothetical protein